MSRLTTTRTVPDPPDGLELSPIPNIRMASGAAEWVRANLNIPVTERYIRAKTNEKQIRYSIILGVRYYSSQALYDLIMSQDKELSA